MINDFLLGGDLKAMQIKLRFTCNHRTNKHRIEIIKKMTSRMIDIDSRYGKIKENQRK